MNITLRMRFPSGSISTFHHAPNLSEDDAVKLLFRLRSKIPSFSLLRYQDHMTQIEEQLKKEIRNTPFSDKPEYEKLVFLANYKDGPNRNGTYFYEYRIEVEP